MAPRIIDGALVLAGIVLGLPRLARGGLWLPIGLHFAWNLVQGPVLGMPVSGLPTPSLFHSGSLASPMLTGSSFGLEASMAMTAVLGLAIPVLYRRFLPPTAQEAT